MLRDYPLFWYEEAGDPLDFALQAALAEFYPAPMATGENLFSHQDARNLIRYGGMRPDRDWLQFDCALSYGLCEYQRTLAVLHTHGWSPSRCIPHGGHQMSLNIAAASLTACGSRTGTSRCPIFRASALKGSPISTGK
jgi:L-alanine-DL-glutamate epimerase-like enolase superfamily enzyme